MTPRVAVTSLIGGLLGGLLGAGVMSAGHAFVTGIGGKDAAPPVNQATDDDATIKIATRASELVRHRPLAPSEKALAGDLVHYGFGATMGALYGAAAAVTPVVTIGAGTAYGAAVWLGAHAIIVPALGLARSPLREPPGKEALELVLHLAYGVAVGLVHRAVVRISR